MNPKRIIPGQSDQGVLFSLYYISDRLPKDHEVFEFQKLIKEMDLSSLIETYGDEGGRMYSPRDLIAIVCYGYHKNLPSAYKRSDAVANRLDFIYLADQVGLIDREKIFAADGTKIRSSAYRDQRKRREDWVEVQSKLVKSVEDFWSLRRSDSATFPCHPCSRKAGCGQPIGKRTINLRKILKRKEPKKWGKSEKK